MNIDIGVGKGGGGIVCVCELGPILYFAACNWVLSCVRLLLSEIEPPAHDLLSPLLVAGEIAVRACNVCVTVSAVCARTNAENSKLVSCVCVCVCELGPILYFAACNWVLYILCKMDTEPVVKVG